MGRARRLSRTVLNEHPDVPRFRQIQNHILDQITTGKLCAGQRLPPLRQWAGEIGVAYETMSKAVRDLVAKGILVAAPRRGTTVAARGNARGHVGAVGLVTTDNLLEFLRSRFYSAALPTVLDEMMFHHERVIHERWNPRKPMTEMFDHLRLVDGILLMGNVPYPVAEIKAIERLGVPVMLIGGVIRDEDVWMVRSDDVSDARNAVKRLVDMGYTSIAAWAGGRNDDRFQGYRLGLKDAGLPYRVSSVFLRRTDDVADKLARLHPRPQVLLVLRHIDGVKDLVAGLNERGIRPGHDLYVCSYDDDLWQNLAPLGAPYAHIEQQIAETAHTAAQVMLNRVEGRPAGTVQTFLPARFIAVPGRATRVPQS